MIYVHIPFCHSKCAYCDFYSIPNLRDLDACVKQIIRELSLRIDELPSENAFDTIYIGGGTPSILSSELFATLAKALFKNGETREFTIEVNPEDVTVDKAQAWKKSGVNRISMGVQSFKDNELQAVGRRHSASDAVRAFNILRECGFENISCDLIFGLPQQTMKSWEDNLQKIIQLHPEHISVYCLTVEEGTRLSRWMESGRFCPTDDSLLIEMYNRACCLLSNAGYSHYEISNYALEGFQSVHNSAYWTGKPYIGLGPAAHSLDINGIRRWNPSNIKEWLHAEKFPVAVIDYENDIERLNDLIICRLRTSQGLVESELPPHLRLRFRQNAKPFLENGQLIEKNGNFRIPEKSWIVADSVLRELIFV